MKNLPYLSSCILFWFDIFSNNDTLYAIDENALISDNCDDEEDEGDANTESEDEDFEPVSENEDEEEYENVKIEGDELGEDSNDY